MKKTVKPKMVTDMSKQIFATLRCNLNSCHWGGKYVISADADLSKYLCGNGHTMGIHIVDQEK